ncbi:hypothetical protein [Novipirellula artificiosorum]|uniref:hypothetical protein n=1 Tax=Novipirellula artificiosorum TaxID=2528016 RepID=UPI0011B67D8A|nr:hypothetical protein [Novipirellula artificiosorum]
MSLCRVDGVYQAGESLTVHWRISRVPIDQLQGLELSVLWHTEGKGDEDLHVHHFHRLDEDQLRQTGIADSQSISCKLPCTPLSYHGHLVRICWCIRLRLFLEGGREIVSEHPLHLVSSRQVAQMQSDDIDNAKLASVTSEYNKSKSLGMKPRRLAVRAGLAHRTRMIRRASFKNSKSNPSSG